ncbi:hypothetical protein MKX03_033121 [Papaver bracteatum]|nr:hypothetical protein MKX03_033121 [Papaver bracteatum]
MEKIQQKDLERPTSSNGRTFFTCEICVQIVPVNRQFNSMEMSGCLHPYCTDCVAKYIQEKVIQHNMSEIKCANWCRVLCESLVLLDSSKGGVAYGRSYCPFRDCSELILNECVRIAPSTSNNNCTSNKITASNCPNCKKLFCFHCMVSFNDVLFMEMVKRKRLVRCPNCFRYVEHTEGCASIKCRCKTKFCYKCGRTTCECKYTFCV